MFWDGESWSPAHTAVNPNTKAKVAWDGETWKPLAAPGPQSTALGAGLRGAVRGAAPALGGYAGAVGGAELGGGLGLLGGPLSEITVPAGALVGGIGGALVGGTGVAKAQDWLLKKLPQGVRQAIGQDEATQQADVSQHPYAAMAGELIPNLAVMRPGKILSNLPENASRLEKLAANPLTHRALGAGIMGAQEAGMQYATQGQVDPMSVGIAAGAGALMNKPTKLGQRIAAPISQAFRGPGMAEPVAAGESPELLDALQQQAAQQQAPQPMPVEQPAPAQAGVETGPGSPETTQPPTTSALTPPPENQTAIARVNDAPPPAELSPHDQVINDHLGALSQSSPTGKAAAEKIQARLADGSVSPTQAYYAIHYLGGSMRRVLGGSKANADVNFVTDLLGGDAKAQGSYDPVKNLLEFSLHPDALQYASETGGHEAFHLLQKNFSKFDPAAERTLGKDFKDGMTLNEVNPKIQDRLKRTAYPGREQPTTIWDELVRGQGGDDAPFASRAEAEAHIFGAIDAARAHGEKMVGAPAAYTRFSKFVSDFKSRVKNGLEGDGLQTPEDVLNAYSGGKAAETLGGSAPIAPAVVPANLEVREDYNQQPPQYSARKVDPDTAEKIVADLADGKRKPGIEKKYGVTREQIHQAMQDDMQRKIFGDEPQYSARKTDEGLDAFSALRRGIEGISQNKATPDQWAGIINNLKNKGVKQEEIDFTGVGQFLAGFDKDTPVNKQMLLAHIEENNLKPGFEYKGGEPPFPESAMHWKVKNTDVRENGRFFRRSNYTVEKNGVKAEINFDPTMAEYVPTVDGQVLDPAYSFKGAARAINKEMGSAYTGKPTFVEYRAPGGKDYREMFLTAPESDRYENWKDGHSAYDDVLNPIVRMRADTRIDPDGSRRLHLAEIQPPKDSSKMPAELRSKAMDMGVKQLIQQAARNGYDRISWDSGDTQTKRYGAQYQNLRKVEYDEKTHDLKVYEYNHDPEDMAAAYSVKSTPEKLDQHIPKEFARRLMSKEGRKKSIAGEDLVFKGEGLKNLYDKKLPALFEKYGKQYGLKTDQVDTAATPHKYTVEPDNMDTGAGPYHVVRDDGQHVHTTDDLADAEAMADERAAHSGTQVMAKAHSVKVTPELRESIGERREQQPLWSNRKTDFDGETPLHPEIAYSRRAAQAQAKSITGLDKRIGEVYAPVDPKLSLLDRTKSFGVGAIDPSFWKRLYMKTVDANFPLAELDRSWMKKNLSKLQPGLDYIDRSTGKELVLNVSSYKAASMVNRSAAHAGTDMFTAPLGIRPDGSLTTSDMGADGKIKLPKVPDGKYKGREIPGLFRIWEPAYRNGVDREFHFYLAAKRGLRLAGEKREKVFTAADKAIADQLEQKFDGTNDMPNFREMADMTHEFNREKLRVSTRNTLTQEERDKYLATADYTPFYRDFEKEGIAGPVFVEGVNTGESVLHRRLKGSDAKLISPEEAWYRHLQAIDHAMMSNESAARAADQGLDTGVVRLAKEGDTDNVITVRRSGVKTKYVVDDPLLHEALAATDGRPLDALTKILRIPTNILRTFTTHVPTFVAMHAMRESMTGFVTGDGRPLIPIIDAIRGIRNSLTNSASAQAIQAHGITGNFDYRPGYGQNLGDKVRDRAARELGLEIEHASDFKALIHKFWGKYETLLKAADAGVRTRVYENEMALHGNPAEAAYQSGAKAVNFQRRGASPWMSHAFSAIPFLNARIQGTDLILRTMVNQGKNKGLGGVLFSRGMALAGITGAYYMAVRNNDTYKKAASIYKDGYWIIPMDMFGGKPGQAILMPIPFEAGVLYKNIPEHIMRSYFGDDKAEDLQRSFETAMMDTLKFNPIPQAILPALEVTTNHSFYTGRQIVPEGMKMPGARKYEVEPNTSLVARKLGELTGGSPIDIDYLIRGYLGTLGEWGTEIGDVAGRGVGAIPPTPDQFSDNPSLANTPFLKRFVRESRRMGDEELSRLYDLHAETQGLVRSLNRMQGAGDNQGVQELVEGNRGNLGVKDYVNQMFNQVSQINKMEMNIQAMPAHVMGGQRKAQLLQQLEDQKYQISRNVETLRERKAQIESKK